MRDELRVRLSLRQSQERLILIIISSLRMTPPLEGGAIWVVAIEHTHTAATLAAH